MGANIAFTQVCDFYYKRLPTGSEAITNISWSYQIVNGPNGTNRDLVRGFYNFPVGVTPYLTRGSESLDDTDSAFPFGSAAADFLWNCLVPTHSVSQSYFTDDGGSTYSNYTDYNFTYNSASFFYDEYLLLSTNYGLSEYPITSSWKAYEPRLYRAGHQLRLVRNDNNNTTFFPANPASTLDYGYRRPSTYNETIPKYGLPGVPAGFGNHPPPGTNPTMITYDNEGTGSNDGRFFDLAGGISITRSDISASLVEWENNKTLTSSAGRAAAAAALKKRRLFFPTIYATGSAGGFSVPNPQGVEWLFLVNGVQSGDSTQYFDENGGIYNVKFNLKRDVTNDMYPDSGQGSELLVYIFDVNRIRLLTAGVSAQPGDIGFYPPENNIVRIKNTPVMSFVNPATGFLIESFNINVVQYGVPAQLVFEASGSLASEKYFGCVIDDINFCKVGVSTDPDLIKPTTTGTATKDQVAPETPPDI